MAEKKKNIKKKKDDNYDFEHDKTITLMTGIVVVLASVGAIAVACIYCLNKL